MSSNTDVKPVGPSLVNSTLPANPINPSWQGRACTWLKSVGSKIVDLFKKIIFAIFPFCRPKTVVVPPVAIPDVDSSSDTEEDQDESLIPEAHLKVFNELGEKLDDPANNADRISRLLKKIKSMAPKKSSPMDEELRQAYIDKLNKLRAPYFGSNKKENDAWFKELNSIALSFITKLMPKNLSDDMNVFATTAIKKHDGKITHAGKSTLGTVPDNGLKKAWNAAHPNNSFPQGLKFRYQHVKALSQVNGSNNFCGYYALFFLLQTGLKQSLHDEDARENFNTQLNDWIKIKVRKSLEAKLERMEVLPLEMEIPDDFISSLSPEEICEIMKSNVHLKNQTNWFVIDAAEEITDDLRAIGLDESSNIYPQERKLQKSDLPLLLIVKQRNGHYYFVKVHSISEKTYKFTIAHSLSGNVSVTWAEKHWTDLLNYVFRVSSIK